MRRVENGPVHGLPKKLRCGECQGKSGPARWEVYAQESGPVLGAVGFAKCRRCGAAVVGLVSNDPEFLADLEAVAREAL